ncbi:MAG: PorT family protein [Bacteroidales bacterium]|nr:PorT family protein [Bacteroidales bacterium]
MKKILIIIAAALLSAAASDAQGRYHGPHHDHYVSPAEGLGLHFGYVHSFNRISDKYSDDVDSSDGKNGFHVGMTKDFTLIPYALYIQSGLDYVYQMRTPDVTKIGSLKILAKDQEHRINIPLKLKYEYPVTPMISAFAQVGPTFSFGLASGLRYRARTENGNAYVSYNYYTGKLKTGGDAGFMEEIVNSQSPEAKYRRFDALLGGAVGAKFFDILEASIGYDWGLVNQYRGNLGKDFAMRRQQLYVTLAVRF